MGKVYQFIAELLFTKKQLVFFTLFVISLLFSFFFSTNAYAEPADLEICKGTYQSPDTGGAPSNCLTCQYRSGVQASCVPVNESKNAPSSDYCFTTLEERAQMLDSECYFVQPQRYFGTYKPVGGGNPPPAGVKELQQLFLRILTLSVGLAFIAITIMITVAGFKFLTSGGDQKRLESARQTATWAVAGILFMVGAWIALRLISAFVGIDLTCFYIGFEVPAECR